MQPSVCSRNGIWTYIFRKIATFFGLTNFFQVLRTFQKFPPTKFGNFSFFGRKSGEILVWSGHKVIMSKRTLYKTNQNDISLIKKKLLNSFWKRKIPTEKHNMAVKSWYGQHHGKYTIRNDLLKILAVVSSMKERLMWVWKSSTFFDWNENFEIGRIIRIWAQNKRTDCLLLFSVHHPFRRIFSSKKNS